MSREELRPRGLRQRIEAGETTLGSWMSLGSAGVAEVMAGAGFDWLVIDLEHTAISLGAAEAMIRVLDLKRVPALVRLSSNDPVQIKRVLDTGAHGIIVPSVNSAEEARRAVRAAHYPPLGNRGVGLGRAQGYGPGFEEYLAWSREEIVVILQIEHAAGVENLEEILDVPRVSGTIIGPYDLSGSIGKPGQMEHVEVTSLLDRYQEVSASKGKAMGYHVIEPSAEAVQTRISQGYTFLAFSTDFLFLGTSCRNEMTQLLQDPHFHREGD